MMWKQINLQEVFEQDRYAEGRYTWLKAECAAGQRPNTYRVEGDILYVDTSRAKPTIEQIKDRLHWGCQWNSWEV